MRPTRTTASPTTCERSPDQALSWHTPPAKHETPPEAFLLFMPPDFVEIAHAPVPVVGLWIVLDLFTGDRDLRLVVQHDHRLIVEQDLLSIHVRLRPLGLVEVLAAIVEQLVELRIGVFGEVESCFGVQQ